MKLIEQIEQRLSQAIKESNLENNYLERNIALIQTLTNLWAVIRNYEKYDKKEAENA